MLRPTAFVVDSFIDYLEKKEQEFSSVINYVERTENKKKLETIYRIREFLLASNINTDLPEDVIVKYYKKVAGNKNFTCLKENIYFNAVKNDLNPCSESFEQAFENGNFSFEKFSSFINDQNAVYFIPCNTGESEEIQDKFGLVVIGTDFDFNSFYEDRNIIGKRTSKEMDEIEVCKHPCNSLIIVDPYFFSGDKNWEHDKAPGIIKTIKTFMSEKLSLKFHLLILTKMDKKKYPNYGKKIEYLIEKLGGSEKIFIETYIPEKIFSDDRIILTNYANINIGHPFDRETYLNCNIFFSDTNKELIGNNYIEQMKQYGLVKKEVQGTPEKMGSIETIYRTDNNEKNRLLFNK